MEWKERGSRKRSEGAHGHHAPGEKRRGVVVEAIPTGSLSLDLALGIGGVPKGRIIEIYGPESSGKTTWPCTFVGGGPEAGGRGGLHRRRARPGPLLCPGALGVDIDSMLISQPDTGEQGWRSARPWSAPAPSTWWWWTRWPPWCPGAEIEGDMGDSHVGLLARLMSQALRKLAGSIVQDQLHRHLHQPAAEKVGVMYGNPEVTTGGRALKFYASVRIDVRRGLER